MNVNKIDDLLALPGSDLKLISGAITATVSNVSTPANLKKGSLVFISSKDHWQQCLIGKPAIVIAHESLLIANAPKDMCLLSTRNIKKAMTYILPLFDQSPYNSSTGIHATASIAPDAVLGKNISVGAHATIGTKARLGDNCVLGPGVVIEDSAVVGDNTILHAHVVVGYNCVIGSHCKISSHTTIGSDGFGFFTDNQYTHSKVPQIGNVSIGDQVEIGSNCCIDRATIESTIIGTGSKMDNLCHIGHNCTIGENAMIAAGFFVAGSTHLGKRFTTGGNTVVSTQLNVADGVMLGGRSTVTNHITEAGQYAGYPLQPLKDALKTISTLGTIVEMRKKINLILKTLSLKE